jgi:hypothetical protein
VEHRAAWNGVLEPKDSVLSEAYVPSEGKSSMRNEEAGNEGYLGVSAKGNTGDASGVCFT